MVNWPRGMGFPFIIYRFTAGWLAWSWKEAFWDRTPESRVAMDGWIIGMFRGSYMHAPAGMGVLR